MENMEQAKKAVVELIKFHQKVEKNEPSRANRIVLQKLGEAMFWQKADEEIKS